MLQILVFVVLTNHSTGVPLYLRLLLLLLTWIYFCTHPLALPPLIPCFSLCNHGNSLPPLKVGHSSSLGDSIRAAPLKQQLKSRRGGSLHLHILSFSVDVHLFYQIPLSWEEVRKDFSFSSSLFSLPFASVQTVCLMKIL